MMRERNNTIRRVAVELASTKDRRGFRPPPSITRSSLVLETTAEMMATEGFPLNQAQIQLRTQGQPDWAATISGSDSYQEIARVGRREIDIALLNPAGPLAAAYRGKGPFSEPVPVRAIAVIPSLDWLAFAVADRTGLRSLADVKEQRYPLRISMRAQRDHATHMYVEHVFNAYGFSMMDLLSWGGAIVPDWQMSPHPSRTGKITSGQADALFDEAALPFIPQLGDLGMHLLPLDEQVLKQMDDIGFQSSPIPKALFPNLAEDVPALDFSGWPIYTHAEVSDDLIYRFCKALDTRKSAIVWQEPRDLPIEEMVVDRPDAPLRVPFHPGAERYWKEAGYL